MLEMPYVTLLAVSAFCLGACPFSVWIGRWALGKDIRDYGDGNPGAVNVFRAGSHKWGVVAVILDIAKGVPFVLLAHAFFKLPEIAVMAVALSAILGHAFSPLLRLRGGKAIAVTIGTLSALPQYEMLITFIAFMFLGFLFIDNDAWRVILGPVGSLAYLITTGADMGQSVFMLCVLTILVVKHFEDLQTVPRPKGKLVTWFYSRRR